MKNNLISKTFVVDGINIDVMISSEERTAWLTTEQIAKLYSKKRNTIDEQIRQLISKDNMDLGAVCRKNRQTGSDGKSYLMNLYILDLVVKIGNFCTSRNGEYLKQLIVQFFNENGNEIEEGIIIYNNGNLNLDVTVSPKEKTVWLSQFQIALLFESSQPNVSRHIKNIIDDGELEYPVYAKNAYTETYCKKVSIIAEDGKTYSVEKYNLDMILAVGYRIKTNKAIEFRRWASNVLTQYLIKGYAINEQRIAETRQIFKIESDVQKLKKEINDIKEKIFIEPIKERLFFDGEYYDAREFIQSLVKKTQNAVILIDPYIDNESLSFFKQLKEPSVIRIIGSSKSKLNMEDIASFTNQYNHQIYFSKDNSFNDRFLIVDDKECYSIGASLNHIGNKVFAVNKIEDPLIIEQLIKRCIR